MKDIGLLHIFHLPHNSVYLFFWKGGSIGWKNRKIAFLWPCKSQKKLQFPLVAKKKRNHLFSIFRSRFYVIKFCFFSTKIVAFFADWLSRYFATSQHFYVQYKSCRRKGVMLTYFTKIIQHFFSLLPPFFIAWEREAEIKLWFI